MVRNIFDKQYQNLSDAYRKTIYRCLNPLLDIYINKLCPDVDLFLLARGYDNLCIITTYNPGSIILNSSDNKDSLIKMISELKENAYIVMEGVNIDSKGRFPNEHTGWVLGMEKQDGVDIAKQWGQNAFVYYQLKERPELVWVK